MLTRTQRLTSSRLFAHAVKRGRRAGTTTVVLHLADRPDKADVPVQVGFVVSKAVGPAVTRNRVKRRLRHIARQRLSSMPGSTVLVIRALPAAATASYASLLADFDAALDRLARRGRAAGSPT